MNRPARYGEVVVGIGLSFLLLISVFLFGSVHSLWYTFLHVSVFLLASVWIGRMLLLSRTGGGREWGEVRGELSRLRPLWPGLAAGCGLALLQLVPMPGLLVAGLSPSTAEVHRLALAGLEPGWRLARLYTLSTWPHQTLGDVIQLSACVAALVISAQVFSRPSRLRRLSIWLVLIGAGVALMALAQEHWTPGKIYGAIQSEKGGSPFGPFYNRNHFAGYMVIATSVTMGLTLYVLSGLTRRRAHAGCIGPFVRVLPLPVLAVMLSALFQSQSRGGAVGLAVAVAAFVVMAGLMRRNWRGVAVAAAVVAPLLLAATAVMGADLYQRFVGIRGERVTRFYVWRDAARMAVRFPVFGTGLGSFKYIFPMYKIPPTSLRPYAHANNEYLELFAEAGIAGLAAALLVFCVWARAVWRGLRAAGGGRERWLLAGAAAGVLGMAAHCAFEFNLHITANAFLFVVLAGGSYGVARRWETADASVSERGTSAAPARWPVFAGAVWILLFALLSVAAVRRHLAEMAYLRYAKRPRNLLGLEGKYGRALLSAVRLDPLSSDYRAALAEEYGESARAAVRGVRRPYSVPTRQRAEALAGAARGQYETAIRLNPSRAVHHHNFAWLCHWAARSGVGDWRAQGEKELEKTGRLDPRSRYFAYSIFAYYKRRREERPQAFMRWSRRALQNDARRADAVFDELYDANGDLAYWRRLVPANARKWQQLAAYLASWGHTDLAADVLERACFLAGGEKAWVKLSIGRDLLAAGRVETVVEWAEHWIGQHPQHVGLHALLLKALLKCGRRAQAEAHLSGMADLLRDNPAAVAEVETTIMQVGDLKDAVGLLGRLAEVRPRDPSIHKCLGLLYARHRRDREAERNFRKAIEVARVEEKDAYRKALIEFLRGREASAGKDLREGLKRLDAKRARR